MAGVGWPEANKSSSLRLPLLARKGEKLEIMFTGAKVGTSGNDDNVFSEGCTFAVAAAGLVFASVSVVAKLTSGDLVELVSFEMNEADTADDTEAELERVEGDKAANPSNPGGGGIFVCSSGVGR
jgi:hypothetical protein